MELFFYRFFSTMLYSLQLLKSMEQSWKRICNENEYWNWQQSYFQTRI